MTEIRKNYIHQLLDEDPYLKKYVQSLEESLDAALGFSQKQEEEIETLKSLLEEHPSWHGAQIYKQFLYLMQESERDK